MNVIATKQQLRDHLHHIPLTFFSFEVECVATLVGEEASCVEGTACEGEGALWALAQL